MAIEFTTDIFSKFDKEWALLTAGTPMILWMKMNTLLSAFSKKI